MVDPFAPAFPPAAVLIGMRPTLDGSAKPEVARIDGATATLDVYFPAALHVVMVETSVCGQGEGRRLVDLVPNELDACTRLAWLIAESAARTRPTPPAAGEVRS